MSLRRQLPPTLLCALVSALGCGSATTGGAGSGGAAATSSASTSATGGTGATGGTSATGGTGGSTGATSSSTATSTGQGGSGGVPAPVMACSEIPAEDCFSNFDCPAAADRCENRGTADLQVPCCVPGPRGAGKLGEACQGENDCKSALCLGKGSTYLCTDKCTKAGDCPASLPKCITIAFSGSTDKFCTP